RPGTGFVVEVKDSSAFTRIIRFEFNVEQAYVLEFGNLYVRFMKDHGQIEDTGSPVELATTYTTAQLSAIRFVQSTDTLYLVHPDHPVRKIERLSDINWTITDQIGRASCRERGKMAARQAVFKPKIVATNTVLRGTE